MQFKPKTEKEIAEEGMVPPGEYDFEVVEAVEKLSKNNNEMIELKLWVFDQNGKRRTTMDWLLESMAHKLRHATEACGLLSDYETGSLTADDFVGKTGRLKIEMQAAKGNFAARSSVVDYLVAKGGAAPVPRAPSRAAKQPAMAGTDLDDEIPF